MRAFIPRRRSTGRGAAVLAYVLLLALVAWAAHAKSTAQQQLLPTSTAEAAAAAIDVTQVQKLYHQYPYWRLPQAAACLSTTLTHKSRSSRVSHSHRRLLQDAASSAAVAAPSPATAPTAVPGTNIVIITASSPSQSPEVPSPPTPSPTPVPAESPSVTASPGSGVNAGPAQPDASRPDEKLPAVIQAQIQNADGTMVTDTITLSMVVKGVTPDLFNANLAGPVASITATMSGTPQDRWTMALQQQQQQQSGRRLKQQQRQYGSRQLLQQQGVLVILSLFTTNPQIVWYRMAKLAPVAKSNVTFSGCSTEYCARLVTAGVPVDPNSITVTPSYDLLLNGSDSQDLPGSVNVTKAIQVNTDTLKVTRDAAWQGALAVAGCIILVVLIWKRKAVRKLYLRMLGKDRNSKQAAKSGKRKEQRSDNNRGSRDAGSPSPQLSPPTTPASGDHTSEVHTSELHSSELRTSELHTDAMTDSTPAASDPPSDQPDEDMAVAAVPAAGGRVSPRSLSPFADRQQQQYWQQQRASSDSDDDWQEPVLPQLVRFDSAERQRYKAAAAAAVRTGSGSGSMSGVSKFPGPGSRSGSAASSARVETLDTSSISSSAVASIVHSESSSMAAAAAARKIDQDFLDPKFGSKLFLDRQNAAYAVAYRSSAYEDSASEPSSQYHEIEIPTGRIQPAGSSTAMRQQQLLQQQRGVRNLDPLEQQALANYFGRMKQQGGQGQMVPYRTTSGLSAAKLAELEQQQRQQQE